MNLTGLPLRELREMTAAREKQMQQLRADRLEIAQEIERRVEAGEDEEDAPARRWWRRRKREDPRLIPPAAQTVTPGFVESEADIPSLDDGR